MNRFMPGVATLGTLLVLGCHGQISQRGTAVPEMAPVSPPPSAGSVSDPSVHDKHGALGVRRLSRFEYGNTVADLLGVTGAEVDVGEDDQVGFLSNNQHTKLVGLVDLEAYERAAAKIVTRALPTLKLPADCPSVTPACAERFLDGFLPRAFRRPATESERKRYAGLYTKLGAGGDASAALGGVLQAVLISPSFLYRTELGSGTALTSYEVASRLSYLLWGSMPDAELFARAQEDALRTPTQIRTQVARMLATPAGARGLLNVVYEMFGLREAQLSKKGRDVLMGLPAGLQSALEEETRRFLQDALLGPGGSYQRLYAARHSYANDAVAAVYGLSGVTGKEFRRVELDANVRRGLFTQPLTIAAHTKESGYSVVQMGRFVRERLLCQEVPPPPPDVSTVLEDTPANADLTYREKFEDHAINPSCRSCHRVLDPPGFAYLSYDPVGRFRPTDPKGKPFDTTGDLVGVAEQPVAFTNAVQMLDSVAASEPAMGCFARKFIEYAFGRSLARDDFPLYRRLVGALQTGRDFVPFIEDLVASQEFVTRGPEEVRP